MCFVTERFRVLISIGSKSVKMLIYCKKVTSPLIQFCISHYFKSYCSLFQKMVFSLQRKSRDLPCILFSITFILFVSVNSFSQSRYLIARKMAGFLLRSLKTVLVLYDHFNALQPRITAFICAGEAIK